MSPLLLDTNAAIWIMRDEPISRTALDAMNAARRSSTDVFVSPVTALEVGQLVSRNRLNLGATPQRWFERLLAIPGMRLAYLSPDLLIGSSYLPRPPPPPPMEPLLL